MAVVAESVTPNKSGVFVLLNRAVPRTGFLMFDGPTLCRTAGTPSGTAVGDFRGSGSPIDLAVADKGSDRLFLLFGDGKGGFSNCATPEQLGREAGGTGGAGIASR